MESSEIEAAFEDVGADTAEAWPHNGEGPTDRATATADEVVLTKTGQRLLAAQRHWLPRGICPDCRDGTVAGGVCDKCGLDWVKELKEMQEPIQNHLRAGGQVYVVSPPGAVAVFVKEWCPNSYLRKSMSEAHAVCVSCDVDGDLITVELLTEPGYRSTLPAEWIHPPRLDDRVARVVQSCKTKQEERVFTKQDLLELHDRICHDAKDLMVLKNQDYSGATDDPFGNFRASHVVGIDPVAGIMLRCLDKFSRLKSFIATGNLVVKDEPVQDIFRDVINYMILAAGMVEEARRLKKQADCTVSLSELP